MPLSTLYPKCFNRDTVKERNSLGKLESTVEDREIVSWQDETAHIRISS
jgi:hypothetical protein